MITRAVGEHRPPPRHITISKLGNSDIYPESDLDYSQNLMESKFDQDPSSQFSSRSSYQQYFSKPVNCKIVKSVFVFVSRCRSRSLYKFKVISVGSRPIFRFFFMKIHLVVFV